MEKNISDHIRGEVKGIPGVTGTVVAICLSCGNSL